MAAVLNSNELKVGAVFVDDGQSFVVLKYQHIKKGRGQATIRVKVRNIENGAITEKTYSNEEKVQAADVEKRTSQYLYADDNRVYFMDNADYSQFDLDKEQLEWEMNFLHEGDSVVTLFLNGNAVSIEIPKSAELTIVETSPAVAGNTATNATKEATADTGYKMQVPLFIESGQVIKVNTEMGTYVSRG
jgi:elongation factor P